LLRINEITNPLLKSANCKLALAAAIFVHIPSSRGTNPELKGDDCKSSPAVASFLYIPKSGWGAGFIIIIAYQF
jgi:hypothetical protein